MVHRSPKANTLLSSDSAPRPRTTPSVDPSAFLVTDRINDSTEQLRGTHGQAAKPSSDCDPFRSQGAAFQVRKFRTARRLYRLSRYRARSREATTSSYEGGSFQRLPNWRYDGGAYRLKVGRCTISVSGTVSIGFPALRQ